MHGKIDALLPHLDEARCPLAFWLHNDLAPSRRARRSIRAPPAYTSHHREIDKVVSAGCTAFPPTRSANRRAQRYVAASEALERAISTWDV